MIHTVKGFDIVNKVAPSLLREPLEARVNTLAPPPSLLCTSPTTQWALVSEWLRVRLEAVPLHILYSQIPRALVNTPHPTPFVTLGRFRRTEKLMETYRVSLARPPHPESLLFVLDERLTVDAGVCPLPRPLPYIALVVPLYPAQLMTERLWGTLRWCCSCLHTCVSVTRMSREVF